MTSKTIEGYELPLSALSAAIVCAAINDVRYYLNGVCLDFANGRIVTTDGHRLFVGAVPVADCEPVILPRDLVENVLKVKIAKRERETCSVIVNVTNDDGTRRVEINHVLAGARFMEAAVDGTFPVYQRVIPPEGGEEVNTCGHYNPQYIVDARTALCRYAGFDAKNDRQFPFIEQRGPSNPCVISFHGVEALCVVMSMRAGDDIPSRAWLTAKPAKTEPQSETAAA